MTNVFNLGEIIPKGEGAPKAKPTTSAASTTPPAEKKPQKPPTKTAARAPKDAAASPRISLHFWPGQYDEMRAAYIADWEDGGECDQLGRWVEKAFTAHAERTTAEREAIAATLSEPEGRGSPRSFAVSAEVDQAVKQARKHDARRYLTASRWASEAIRAAVEAARTRRGGVLPTPPARLPRQMPPRD